MNKLLGDTPELEFKTDQKPTQNSKFTASWPSSSHQHTQTADRLRHAKGAHLFTLWMLTIANKGGVAKGFFYNLELPPNETKIRKAANNRAGWMSAVDTLDDDPADQHTEPLLILKVITT